MKKLLTLTLLSAVILGLSFCLSFCGKKESGEPGQPEIKGTTLGEPGTFGIARYVWDEEVTPQDRISAAAEVLSKDLILEGTEKATIETNKGTFVVKLYSRDAPNTARNFIRLSEVGFYDGIIWHRYEEGFLVQAGDPTGTGRGNPSFTVPFEKNSKKHIVGAMAMARVGADMNSANTQFYVCLAPQPHLDGAYCVFGQVTEGMDVVDQIRVFDTIVNISISQ